jgi:exo-beta-1,3-glucanase (GH17 family)
VRLKLNGTHQLLADVNLLADYINTINVYTETFNTSKEHGLEINVKKTKYMLPSQQQNTSPNSDIKMAYRSFENVSQFKYLGTNVMNKNMIQNLLSACML